MRKNSGALHKTSAFNGYFFLISCKCKTIYCITERYRKKRRLKQHQSKKTQKNKAKNNNSSKCTTKKKYPVEDDYKDDDDGFKGKILQIKQQFGQHERKRNKKSYSF